MAEKFTLKQLSKDHIRKAFNETLKTFNEPGVQLVLVTEEYDDIALTFAREHFISIEPVQKGLGMEWTDDVEDYWKIDLKHGLTLMFLNEKDEEPIAILSIETSRYDDNYDYESRKHQPLKELLRCLAYCEQKAQFYDYFQTEEAFRLLSLAVAPKYKQRGYGTKIVSTSFDFIRNFGIDPVFIKVEGTSNFSKKIFEGMGTENLYEQFFDDWEVEGTIPIQNTGIHRSITTYGIKMTAHTKTM